MKDAAQGKLVDMHSDTGAIDYYNRALEIDIKISGHDCRTWPRPIVTLVLCTKRRATSKTPFFSTKGRSRSEHACSARSTARGRLQV